MAEPSRAGRSTVTRADISGALRAVGLTRRSVVFMHSSLSALGYVEGGADAVVDALLDVVGAEGLASVPTHTWGIVNARQPVFHVELTPSHVGKVTEVFRHRPGAVRSRHPTHSVAAIGRAAEGFVAEHEHSSTPAGRKTPYGRLCTLGGQVLLLGVGLGSWTLMHAFEEWAPVPWLFDRWESLYTVLEDGRTIAVPSQRHTADPGCRRDYPALEPLLRRHGLIRYGSLGSARIRAIDAAGAERLLVPRMRAEPDLVLARRTQRVV